MISELQDKAREIGINIRIWHTNNSKLFKKRDKISIKEYYTYKWNYNNIPIYYGKGIGLRAINHKNDILSTFIKNNIKNMTLDIIAYNLSDLEAKVIESILLCDKNAILMHKNEQNWDGKSLLNKRRELCFKGISYKSIFKQIVNGYYWEAIRRQIYNN